MTLRERYHRLREALKLRFLVVHVIYLLVMSIIGSILLYPQKNMLYIDSLFFAVGACTQSGLNTINLNDLTTFQQVVLYLLPVATNPLTINSFLVFVRLHWFEKEFDNIAERARQQHKLRKSRSVGIDEQEPDIESHGVRGRPITIIGSAKMTEGMFPGQMSYPVSRRPSPDREKHTPSTEVRSDSSSTDSSPLPVLAHRPEPDIRFAELPTPRRDVDDYVTPGPALVIKSPRELELEEPDRIAEEPAGDHDTIRFGDLPSPHRATHARQPSHQLALSALSHRRGGSVDLSRGSSPPISPTDERDIRFGDLPSPRDLQHAPHARADSYDSDGPAYVVKSPREQELERRRIHGRTESDLDDTLEGLERAQSHIIVPSPDATGGHKFSKRSMTIEAPEANMRRRSSFGQMFRPSATIDRFENLMSRARLRRSDTSPVSRRSSRAMSMLPYLSYQPTIARNSFFVGLSEEQREELGGVEYRALKLLAKIVVGYIVVFFVFGIICLIPWILNDGYYRSIVDKYAVRPAWWAVFMTGSSFFNVGYSLLPSSMTEFNRATFPLLLMSFLIAIGNTGFPCMLRFIIWLAAKCFRAGSSTGESLSFLLDHPRRCFTLLFPSKPTWWLLFVLLVLNLVDLFLFLILDFHSEYLSDISGGFRFVDGLFQAFSTRVCGLNVVDLARVHPAVQVSYMVMMYISVLPVAISVRRTNVYEEQSLGIYIDSSDSETEYETDSYDPRSSLSRRSSLTSSASRARRRKRKPTLVASHIRRQLSFDLWFLFLGVFLICCSEGHRLRQNDIRYTIFTILFEAVSAYGTVGLSLGYTDQDTSFSGQFNTLSKLVLVALMIRGRHRGLPYALDRAVLLPSQALDEKDRRQEQRADRRMSMATTLGRTSGYSMGRRVQSQALSID
ncbi:cation transport protein-domain-containing protein [Dipodascopsis tothii]|uniref:cation transport protein-domain-containing protein n=1 Tax=Dipodascopsis tothii TaxID=44089 RepID=UPI0034CD8812